MVEVGAAHVETLAAQKFDARRAAGNGEIEHVGFRSDGVPASKTGRVDGDFVGDRPQRRQNTRAVQHQAGVCFPHHAQPHAIGQLELARGAPALQIDQGMGQSQIVFPDVLIVLPDVRFEGRAVLSEIVRRGAPGGEIDVQKIRRTPQHAAPGARPAHHHPAALLEFGLRLRNDEGVPYPVAGGR